MVYNSSSNTHNPFPPSPSQFPKPTLSLFCIHHPQFTPSLFFSNHRSPPSAFQHQHSTFHHLPPVTHDSLSSSHPPPLAIAFHFQHSTLHTLVSPVTTHHPLKTHHTPSASLKSTSDSPFTSTFTHTSTTQQPPFIYHPTSSIHNRSST